MAAVAMLAMQAAQSPPPLAAIVPPPPVDQAVHTPINPWRAIISTVMRHVRKIPRLSHDMIIAASTLAGALAVLGACVALVVLTYILVYILRPRLFTISHSSQFDTYMTGTSTEIAHVMIRLSKAISSGALDSVLDMDNGTMEGLSLCEDQSPSGVETLRTVGNRISAELAGPVTRADLPADVLLYFQFHRSLASMKPDSAPVANMLSRMDLKTEVSFQNDITGETDADKVAEFHKSIFLPLCKLRKDVTLLSIRLNAACGMKITPDTSKGIMDIHLLRLHLDVYHDQTAFSFETRKSGPGRLPTAIMTLFWWPSVEHTYLKSIPSLWTSAPGRFKSGLDQYDKAWTALGPFILKLPCWMSHLDADERKAKCDDTQGDSFVDGARVVEGFSIGSLITGIVNLIRMLVPMVISIAEFIVLLASDPFQAIFSIIMLVLGMVIGLVGYLSYVLLTLTQLYWLPGLWYAWNISFVYAFWLTNLEVWFTVVLAIPYGLLTLVDLVTAGSVMHLLRCESLPSDLAVSPYTAFDNVRRRFGLMCSVPCSGVGFVPAFGGVACSCMPSDLPPFCPQQQLFRAFRSMPLGDPWIFDGFTADTAFYSLNPRDQQKHMASAYRRKTAFIGRCYASTSSFSFLTRHVCSNLDALLPEAVSSEDKAKLAQLCHQAHCNFGPPPGDDSSTHLEDLSTSPDAVMLPELGKASFCMDAPRPVVEADASNVTSGLSQAIMLMTLAACMAMVILYALLG